MQKSAFAWMVTPLQKYASFSGRARRAEYWWFSLFIGLLLAAATLIDVIVFGYDPGDGDPTGSIVAGLVSLAIFLPAVGVGIRRMHDRDKSGWWILWGLVPLIGGLIVLYQYVQRGTIGDNRFGPDPVAGDD